MHHSAERIDVVLTFTAMFTHANIRTPQWLGYFTPTRKGSDPFLRLERAEDR